MRILLRRSPARRLRVSDSPRIRSEVIDSAGCNAGRARASFFGLGRPCEEGSNEKAQILKVQGLRCGPGYAGGRSRRVSRGSPLGTDLPRENRIDACRGPFRPKNRGTCPLHLTKGGDLAHPAGSALDLIDKGLHMRAPRGNRPHRMDPGRSPAATGGVTIAERRGNHAAHQEQGRYQGHYLEMSLRSHRPSYHIVAYCRHRATPCQWNFGFSCRRAPLRKKFRFTPGRNVT